MKSRLCGFLSLVAISVILQYEGTDAKELVSLSRHEAPPRKDEGFVMSAYKEKLERMVNKAEELHSKPPAPAAGNPPESDREVEVNPNSSSRSPLWRKKGWKKRVLEHRRKLLGDKATKLSGADRKLLFRKYLEAQKANNRMLKEKAKAATAEAKASAKALKVQKMAEAVAKKAESSAKAKARASQKKAEAAAKARAQLNLKMKALDAQKEDLAAAKFKAASKALAAQKRVEAATNAKKLEAQRRAEAARSEALEAQRRAEAAARAKALEAQRRAESAARAKALEAQRRAEAAARAKALEAQRRAEAAARAKALEAQRRAEAAARAKALEAQRRAEAAVRAKALEAQRRAEAAARSEALEAQRRAEAAARAKALDAQRRAEAAAKAHLQLKALEAQKEADAASKANAAAQKIEAQKRAEAAEKAEALSKALDSQRNAEAAEKEEALAKALEAQKQAEAVAKAKAQEQAEALAKANALSKELDGQNKAEALAKAHAASQAIEARKRVETTATAKGDLTVEQLHAPSQDLVQKFQSDLSHKLENADPGRVREDMPDNVFKQEELVAHAQAPKRKLVTSNSTAEVSDLIETVKKEHHKLEKKEERIVHQIERGIDTEQTGMTGRQAGEGGHGLSTHDIVTLVFSGITVLATVIFVVLIFFQWRRTMKSIKVEQIRSRKSLLTIRQDVGKLTSQTPSSYSNSSLSTASNYTLEEVRMDDSLRESLKNSSYKDTDGLGSSSALSSILSRNMDSSVRSGQQPVESKTSYPEVEDSNIPTLKFKEMQSPGDHTTKSPTLFMKGKQEAGPSTSTKGASPQLNLKNDLMANLRSRQK